VFRVRSRKPIRRRRRATLAGQVQLLEDRTLLAGDVAALVANGNLSLQGDAADNVVEVTLAQEGVIVRGLDGTTVNGSTNPFLVGSGDAIDGNLVVNLRNGDDVLSVTGGLTVAGDIRFGSGGGTDQIGLDDVTVAGDVSAYGHAISGVHIETSSIGDDLRVHQHAADATVVVRSSDIADDLNLMSHSGDTAVLLEDTTIGDDLQLRTKRGEDSLLLDGVVVEDHLKIQTGPLADFVMLDGVTVGGWTRIRLQQKGDALVLTGENVFGGDFRADGGPGSDAIEIGEGSTFDGIQKLKRFEEEAVSSELIDTRLDAPQTGLRTRAMALWDFFDDVNGDALFVDVDVSMNATTDSADGLLLTNDELFRLDVLTLPGAIVEVDRDGDGAFDDGASVADANGAAQIDVTLIHDAVNRGANSLIVRASDGGDEETKTIDVHYALGTVVRFATSLGAVDVELLDADAPATVANFLGYLDRYGASIIHRSARTSGGDDFIIQGGGFAFDPGLVPISTDAPVANEFSPANSNLRGTLSMALPSGAPDGGTSQWFINVADNAFLDGALHTVFGRVIGTGMTIVDAIHALDAFNLVGVFDNPALATVPLDDYTAFTQDLTGQVSVSAGSIQVAGTGTQFTMELRTGAPVRIAGEEFIVASIANDTSLKLDRPHPSGASSVVAQTNSDPDRADFVELDAVSVILL